MWVGGLCLRGCGGRGVSCVVFESPRTHVCPAHGCVGVRGVLPVPAPTKRRRRKGDGGGGGGGRRRRARACCCPAPGPCRMCMWVVGFHTLRNEKEGELSNSRKSNTSSAIGFYALCTPPKRTRAMPTPPQGAGLRAKLQGCGWTCLARACMPLWPATKAPAGVHATYPSGFRRAAQCMKTTPPTWTPHARARPPQEEAQAPLARNEPWLPFPSP